LPVARQVLGLSSWLAATAILPGTEGVIVRNRDTSKLNVQFRESCSSRELRGVPGRVRAGDREPDAPGLQDHHQGKIFRPFGVFHGPHGTLVAFGDSWTPVLETRLAAAGREIRAIRVLPAGASRANTGRQILATTLGHAYTAWKARARALFAVRPDGVVGFADDRPSGNTPTGCIVPVCELNRRAGSDQNAFLEQPQGKSQRFFSVNDIALLRHYLENQMRLPDAYAEFFGRQI
jgi:hypothetical protein